MKTYWKLFVLAVMLVAVMPGTVALAVEVIFPDANLEAGVRVKLGIPAPTAITDTDMQTMESFLGMVSTIYNIQGLEYATNLTWLDLFGHQVSDISPISGLTNLVKLALPLNPISDISPVAGLTNLTNLNMDYNLVSDISPVAGLTNLTELLMFGNQISDISAISGLTNLTYLDLHGNQISGISAVSGLTNLNRLSLSGNQISDISAVSGLTNLTTLWLNDNQIEVMDLSGADLSSLETFNISGNPLTSVLLTDATLSQALFNVLMGGGYPGIADVAGVLDLDMGGVDFISISDLSLMYTMDDLQTLLLTDATNLVGADVVTLTGELAAMNLLDVTGLWDTFDVGSQSSLKSWDAIEGNTLIVPEPATLSLLALSGLALLRRKKK